MSTTGQAGRSVVPTAGGGGDAELCGSPRPHRRTNPIGRYQGSLRHRCLRPSHRLIWSRGASRSLFGGTPLQCTMALLTILTFLALVGATAFAVLVIRPRKDAPSRWNLLFFQHISEHDEETFIGHFQSQLPHEIATAILAQGACQILDRQTQIQRHHQEAR